MEIENEVDKLVILPERVIHILLKQLMVIKNELAYTKNKMGLEVLDNYVSVNSEGSKHFVERKSDLADGSKHSVERNNELTNGSNDSVERNSELTDGSNDSVERKSESADGSKHSVEPNTELTNGSKHSVERNSELTNGSKQMFRGKNEKREGVNGGDWLHNVFEQQLIEAMEQYIKNGNGQNTLYAFYDDFVDAVKGKNEQEAKLKEAAKQIPLEDTHTLPLIITMDNISVANFRTALLPYMPAGTKYAQSKTVAKELLQLHNAGKATVTQMREFSGLSVGGIAKHLPRLQRADLIKKQPPSNYTLTEKSKLILLKTFGIPKN